MNVWAGILRDHIIGLHFINDKISGKKYRKFLQNDLIGRMPLESRIDIWF